MRRINIYSKNLSTDTEKMVSIQQRSCKGTWDVDKALAELIAKQEVQDILGLGQASGIAESGIRKCVFRDGIWRSWDIEKNESKWNQPIRFLSGCPLENQEIYLAFEMYPYGYVLEMKKRDTNQVFYYGSKGFERIRISQEKDKAQVWISPHYLNMWVQQNLEMIQYMADRGWNFCIRPHNSMSYREDMEALANMRPAMVLSKQNQLMQVISILEEMGTSIKTEYESIQVTSPVSEDCFENSILEETIYRMKSLKLADYVISDYQKHGRIYMSEFYGYPSVISEKAVSFIRRIENIGLIPYHVVRGHIKKGMGETYSVFYVSNNPALWKDERPSEQDSNPVWAFGSNTRVLQVHTVPVNGGVIIQSSSVH